MVEALQVSLTCWLVELFLAFSCSFFCFFSVAETEKQYVCLVSSSVSGQSFRLFFVQSISLPSISVADPVA